MRIIKRYKNRRLYDTELKKSITLNDVRNYVDSGVQIQVIDNTNGTDITVTTLVTVLSRTTSDVKSLEKNESIIEQLNLRKGDAIMDAMKKLMLAGLGAVHLSKERLEELFDELVKKGEMTSGEKAEAMKKMADKIEAGTSKVVDTVETKVADAVKKINVKAKIDNLESKIDALTKQVDKLTKKLNGE